MSKCTAAQAVQTMEYWVGYYEKATSKYVSRRDKDAFSLDKGSNNYTYAGYLCGINGPAAAWCAMQVTTAITEACGGDKAAAKEVMFGVWPYTACNQLWDEARTSDRRGRRGSWTPKPGDVIVFTDNGTSRDHTGMVYAVDNTYVYTIEGNSANMCRKRSYLKTSSYIYGYVRPDYAKGDEPEMETEQYGAVCCKDPELHVLSKGCAGPEVKTVQRVLYSKGYRGADGKPITVDGEFGANTAFAVKTMQKKLGLAEDSIVGARTWAAMLTGLD